MTSINLKQSDYGSSAKNEMTNENIEQTNEQYVVKDMNMNVMTQLD